MIGIRQQCCFHRCRRCHRCRRHRRSLQLMFIVRLLRTFSFLFFFPLIFRVRYVFLFCIFSYFSFYYLFFSRLFSRSVGAMLRMWQTHIGCGGCCVHVDVCFSTFLCSISSNSVAAVAVNRCIRFSDRKSTMRYVPT